VFLKKIKQVHTQFAYGMYKKTYFCSTADLIGIMVNLVFRHDLLHTSRLCLWKIFSGH